jgi:hypothetical protein
MRRPPTGDAWRWLAGTCGLRPFAWPDHRRINVAVLLRPWTLGGGLHVRLRSVSARETEVEISGLGMVRREVERMAAALLSD